MSKRKSQQQKSVCVNYTKVLASRRVEAVNKEQQNKLSVKCASVRSVYIHFLSVSCAREKETSQNTALFSGQVTNFTKNLILTTQRHCLSNKYKFSKLHCFAMLVALPLRSALFWDFSQFRVVIRTDVSVQRAGPFFKAQAVNLDCLSLEDWTGKVFAIRRYKLTLYTAKKSIRGQPSFTQQRKPENKKFCSSWTT